MLQKLFDNIDVPCDGRVVKWGPTRIIFDINLWVTRVVKEGSNDGEMSFCARHVKRGPPKTVGDIQIELGIAWMSEKELEDLEMPISGCIVKWIPVSSFVVCGSTGGNERVG